MSYALDRAAEELKSQLEKFENISVPKGQRVIIWDNTAYPISEGTSKAICLRKLRKLIAIEKKREFERTQTSLL